MRKFACPNCAGQLYFENFACGRCGSGVEFNPLSRDFECLDAGGPSLACGNRDSGVCNWRKDWSSDSFCRACKLNHTIPRLDAEGNLELWKRLEVAKRRVLYDLGRLGLTAPQRGSEGEFGLAFDFLSPADGKVITGHDSGLITINLAEADDAHREQVRTELGEPYRTLVGHFRHECGHYLFDRFVAGTDELLRFLRDIWRRTPGLCAGAEGLLRASAGMARAFRLRLCGLPSLGGLGRELRPLSPYRLDPRHVLCFEAERRRRRRADKRSLSRE